MPAKLNYIDDKKINCQNFNDNFYHSEISNDVPKTALSGLSVHETSLLTAILSHCGPCRFVAGDSPDDLPAVPHLPPRPQTGGHARGVGRQQRVHRHGRSAGQ